MNDTTKESEMNYEQAKFIYDTIGSALNTVTAWHTEHPMSRTNRQRLFDVEDRLSKAASALFDLMQNVYEKDPEWRKWAIREGWLYDDFTAEEEEYAKSLD